MASLLEKQLNEAIEVLRSVQKGGNEGEGAGKTGGKQAVAKKRRKHIYIFSKRRKCARQVEGEKKGCGFMYVVLYVNDLFPPPLDPIEFDKATKTRGQFESQLQENTLVKQVCTIYLSPPPPNLFTYLASPYSPISLLLCLPLSK